MKLATAEEIAQRISTELSPVSQRVLVVGSVRRRKALPHDLELCVIPREIEQKDLFGETLRQRDPAFSAAVKKLGHVEMGDPANGKYVKVDLGECMLDLFIARPENWGFLVVIRTGPAEYSALCMSRLKHMGFQASEGQVWDRMKGPIPVREEKDFFDLLGRRMPAPEERLT